VRYFSFIQRIIPFALVASLFSIGPNTAHADDPYFNKKNDAPINSSSSSARLWNLQDVDVRQVAAEVSRETGKNFLIDPRVSGKISIISSTPMEKDEVYQMFLSMLQVLGYTVIASGDVYKIVPLAGSVSQPIPVSGAAHPGQGDELVVRIIPVRNVSASKLVPILRPLIPDNGGISAYFPANSLIITSTARNIDRLMKVISDLDKANTTHVEVVSLRNSSADQVVSILGAMQPDTSDESHVSLAADNHTNSILIRGDQQGRKRMRALIANLDNPPPEGFEGNTQVVYLHYLKAAKMAPILTKVAQADATEVSGEKKETSSNSNISIQAEPTTNALIITAPPAIMHNLQAVIARLDVRPAQVLVEAAIVEIDEGTLKRLGVQWGTINHENSNVSGTLNDSAVTAVETGADDSATPQAITNGTLPIGYNQGVGVIKMGNFRAIVTMLQQSESTDVLSTPSLVVLDNQTAKIEVGKQLSIQTGSYANTDASNNNSVTPFNTFDRQQIGLHLYVTPQINRGDAVQLRIDQGNATLVNPVNPGTTPETNNSAIKTTVLVNTGDILVLGGLISNNQQEGETKIPIVGDIPGIGRLFKYKTHAYVKKNLMVFLKPIILYNKQNNIDITNAKYEYMRNNEISWQNHQKTQTPTMLPPNEPAKLPMPFSASGMAKTTR
jgi:general secretion pathway protein D